MVIAVVVVSDGWQPSAGAELEPGKAAHCIEDVCTAARHDGVAVKICWWRHSLHACGAFPFEPL